MKQSSVSQAVASAAVSLLAFAACVGAFVPPFVESTVRSVPLTIVLGIGIAVSFALHVAFVCIAAQRTNRSPILWGVGTVLLFPVASIVGLILFEWFSTEANQGSAAA
jgi:drug/metabolite transporter (DMT)-like permease